MSSGLRTQEGGHKVLKATEKQRPPVSQDNTWSQHSKVGDKEEYMLQSRTE